jgi:predicted amidohydrolase YtcJ
MDLVLDAYEAADRDKSIAGQRWSIEHAFIGRADHLPRLKKLEIAISAQDHLYLAGPSLVKYWGRERAFLTTPVRTVSGTDCSFRRDGRGVPYPPLLTISLRHARHAQRRRDGHRTAHQPRRRAQAGDDQQCPADVG